MDDKKNQNDQDSIWDKIVKFLKHVIFGIAVDGLWGFLNYLWDLLNGLPTKKDVGDPAHGLGNGEDSTSINPTEIPINQPTNTLFEENNPIMFGGMATNETIIGVKLVHAVRNGNLEHLMAIVEQTPIMNAQDKDGKTALIAACEANSLEKVEYLLNLNKEHPIMKKVDVDKADNEGNTALMHSAKTGNKLIVKHLINKGAKLDLKNKKDQTASDIAKANGNMEVAIIIDTAIAEKKRKKLKPINKIRPKPYLYLERSRPKKRERIKVRALALA